MVVSEACRPHANERALCKSAPHLIKSQLQIQLAHPTEILKSSNQRDETLIGQTKGRAKSALDTTVAIGHLESLFVAWVKSLSDMRVCSLLVV